MNQALIKNMLKKSAKSIPNGSPYHIKEQLTRSKNQMQNPTACPKRGFQ